VARFRTEVARLGLANRTTLHGWLPAGEVAQLCRKADIFVLPSHAEGQAMSLLEAMAHGLAIVTTPVGAHLEAVTDGLEALLVPPGDVEALASALIRLVDNQDLRLRLGRAARMRYAAEFAIEPYAKRLASLQEAAAFRSDRKPAPGVTAR
jgi:glycosyltransferase involved in cell wall biosynthesis